MALKIRPSRVVLLILPFTLLLLFFLSPQLEENVHEPVQRMCRSETEYYTDHDIHRIFSIVPTATTFLDIGANIGRISFMVASCYTPKHRVISIEPIKQNIAQFNNKRTLLDPDGESLGDRVTLHEVGFSNETTALTLYVPKGRGDNAAMTAEAAVANLPNLQSEPETVHMVNGDEYLKSLDVWDEVGVIKIDTQGSEIRVLKGLKDLLTEKKGLAIVAEWDKATMVAQGVELDEVWKFMKELGYDAYCKPSVSWENGRVVMKGERLGESQARMEGSGSWNKCLKGDLVYWRAEE